MFYLHILMDWEVFDCSAIAGVLLFAFAYRVFAVHGMLYKICPENKNKKDPMFSLLISVSHYRLHALYTFVV